MDNTSDLDKLLTDTRKWAAAKRQNLERRQELETKLTASAEVGLLEGLIGKAEGLIEKDLDDLLP